MKYAIFRRKLTYGFRGQRPRQNPLRWRESLYLLKLIERNYDGSMYMLDGDLLSHAKNLGKRR